MSNLVVIDDASRLVTHGAFYRSENAACLIDALRHAFLRRGIPRRFYCDNGSAFRTHHLELICATLNVTLIHSRPGQPRGRGKNERFYRTVRSAFLPLLDAAHLQDLAALNRVFWAWLEGEYHVSAHGGLENSQTPLDRFLADTALIRPAPEDLERLLRMSVSRRVGKDRTVRLDGRIYEAPFMIQVRYQTWSAACPRAPRTVDTPVAPLYLNDMQLCVHTPCHLVIRANILQL